MKGAAKCEGIPPPSPLALSRGHIIIRHEHVYGASGGDIQVGWQETGEKSREKNWSLHSGCSLALL